MWKNKFIVHGIFYECRKTFPPALKCNAEETRGKHTHGKYFDTD